MNYFPIFLDAKHINAIIIGGGDVAARKIELLLKSTERITVMSFNVCPTVERLIKTHQLQWLAHNYEPDHLINHNLVIAATDNELVNQKIYCEAEALKLLVNVVDQPQLCSYITPSIIDRTPMIIAISSSGYAPYLVRILREKIEKLLPENYGKLAKFSYKFREHVKARIKGVRNRRYFWQKIFAGIIGDAILRGDKLNAEQQLISCLKKNMELPLGQIIFIHTLDGDPELLTLNAHRHMQFADAVFYDETVNINLIEYIRRDADKYPQSIPSSILINYQHGLELAEQGQKVIYLLSGHNKLPINSAIVQTEISIKYLVSGR